MVLSGVPQQTIRISYTARAEEIGGADWVWCYVPGNMRRKALMMMMTWTEWSSGMEMGLGQSYWWHHLLMRAGMQFNGWNLRYHQDSHIHSQRKQSSVDKSDVVPGLGKATEQGIFLCICNTCLLMPSYTSWTNVNCLPVYHFHRKPRENLLTPGQGWACLCETNFSTTNCLFSLAPVTCTFLTTS